MGEDALATYTFGKHVIKHRFCPTCGIHTHGEAADRKGNPMAAINLRCLEGVELDRVEISPFDGRSLRGAALRRARSSSAAGPPSPS